MAAQPPRGRETVRLALASSLGGLVFFIVCAFMPSLAPCSHLSFPVAEVEPEVERPEQPRVAVDDCSESSGI